MAATGALPASGSKRLSLAYPATGTPKPICPAKFKQIFPAGLLAAEPTFQLGPRAGIILNVHTGKHYRLGIPESTG